jgi:hypothetical protein
MPFGVGPTRGASFDNRFRLIDSELLGAGRIIEPPSSRASSNQSSVNRMTAQSRAMPFSFGRTLMRSNAAVIKSPSRVWRRAGSRARSPFPACSRDERPHDDPWRRRSRPRWAKSMIAAPRLTCGSRSSGFSMPTAVSGAISDRMIQRKRHSPSTATRRPVPASRCGHRAMRRLHCFSPSDCFATAGLNRRSPGIMRRVRPQLEPEHELILGQDPRELFDEDKVMSGAREGMIAVDTGKPVFLAIVTSELDLPNRAAGREPAPTSSVAICRGQDDLMNFIHREAPVGMATTSIELVKSAHLLASHLAHTQPNKRGRRG